MVYVVKLNHSSGKVTYAGKDSWADSSEPEYVMSKNGAIGKAKWWQRMSDTPGRSINLKKIEIIPVKITLLEEK